MRDVRTVHQIKNGIRGRRRSRIGGGLKGKSVGRRAVCTNLDDEAIGEAPRSERRSRGENSLVIFAIGGVEVQVWMAFPSCRALA